MTTMRRIVITGASSGIGAALAKRYATRGVTLGLVARRSERLDAVRTACERAGARVYTFVVDVRDAKGVDRVARAFVSSVGGIDLVIANAGIFRSCSALTSSPDKINEIITTNVIGVVNTLVAFIPTMRVQRAGTLVVVSSVAGFKGLPGGAYSASKAAVRYLADGWRPELRRAGIQLTTVYPGFVDSEMTQAKQQYPFLVSADRAAQEIAWAADRGKGEHMFPWQWRVLAPLLRMLPAWFYARRF